MNQSKKLLGLEIFQLRQDKRLTLKQLAAQTRLSQKWLENAELGKGNFDFQLLIRLSKFYDKKSKSFLKMISLFFG